MHDLLYCDGTLQHGGHVYASGTSRHAVPGQPATTTRARSGPSLVEPGVLRPHGGLHRGDAATCSRQVGGFCEGLPGNFNDVDFSRKIGSLDLRLLWMSDVPLYHFESLTRDSTVHQWEYDTIMRRWGTPERDPYFPVASAPSSDGAPGPLVGTGRCCQCASKIAGMKTWPRLLPAVRTLNCAPTGT